MLATPFITQISDRFGRRWSFLLPVWLTVASNILCSVSPNYTAFLVFRFLAGVGTAVSHSTRKSVMRPGQPGPVVANH